MRGPGIPAGTVCNELTSTIDILPTIAALTGEPLARTNKIDGMVEIRKKHTNIIFFEKIKSYKTIKKSFIYILIIILIAKGY